MACYQVFLSQPHFPTITGGVSQQEQKNLQTWTRKKKKGFYVYITDVPFKHFIYIDVIDASIISNKNISRDDFFLLKSLQVRRPLVNDFLDHIL